MTIYDYAKTIYGSTREDWRMESCWGAGSASSFLESVAAVTVNGDFHTLEVKSHSHLASFKLNLSISIAWGYPCLDEFQEDWANCFPNPSASSEFLDFYYNGVLVHRESFVCVDGARCYLPLPRIVYDKETEQVTALTVPGTQAEFYQLLNGMLSTVDFRRYFDGAGFKVVDQPWLER